MRKKKNTEQKVAWKEIRKVQTSEWEWCGRQGEKIKKTERVKKGTLKEWCGHQRNKIRNTEGVVWTSG